MKKNEYPYHLEVNTKTHEIIDNDPIVCKDGNWLRYANAVVTMLENKRKTR